MEPIERVLRVTKTTRGLAFRFKALNHLNKMSDSRKRDDKTAAIAITTL